LTAPTGDLIARFADEMRSRNLAPTTTIHYRVLALRRIEAALGRPLIGATTADLTAHMARRSRELTPGSLAQEYSHLRAFFSWLQWADLRLDDPMVKMRRPKTPSGHPRPVPAEVFAEVMASLVDDRDRAVILLCREAGLRRAEIATLPWSGVQPRTLTVTGKGRRTRTLPLSPALSAALAALSGPRRGHVILNDTGGRWTPNALGIHVNGRLLTRWGVTLHQLRHTFAMELYERTGDLGLVAQALGHASVQTTQVYAAASAARLADGVLAASWTQERKTA
jgi:site-specific recombinase XerD